MSWEVQKANTTSKQLAPAEFNRTGWYQQQCLHGCMAAYMRLLWTHLVARV